MWTSILPASIAVPIAPSQIELSSAGALMGPSFFGFPSISAGAADPALCLTIRMGGGPRTYPGGVSKWQWKRMQAKKATQLLKARLARERQMYEMRKRAELKAAVSELERPWEVVEKAPTLFSVKADEQLKVLADRFQRPGGFDMWSARDGPQVFRTPEGLPSARFFPKGVVHSVKPYGMIADSSESAGSEEESKFDDWIARGRGGRRRRRSKASTHFQGANDDQNGSEADGEVEGVPSTNRISKGGQHNVLNGEIVLLDSDMSEFSSGEVDSNSDSDIDGSSYSLNSVNSKFSTSLIIREREDEGNNAKRTTMDNGYRGFRNAKKGYKGYLTSNSRNQERKRQQHLCTLDALDANEGTSSREGRETMTSKHNKNKNNCNHRTNTQTTRK